MKRTIAFLMIFALLLCAAGCHKTPDIPATDTLVAAMDTEMTLRLYGDTDNAAAKALTEELLRLDAVFSPTSEQSALFALNRFKTSSDPDLTALAAQACDLGVRTDGALDITLAPLAALWGFTGEGYYLPTEEEVAQTLLRTGADKYTVSDSGVQLNGDAALDFGALAKGYAADLCRAHLEKAGIAALLSLGGNVQTVGQKPDGTPWRIGVQDPQDPQKVLLMLDVEGTKSVVTSGDYQRYFDYEGKHYCHIFDPATGSPVQKDLRSVTVIADSGTLADGLSTALFVMGFDAACVHWQQSSDFEAIFVTSEGRIFVTEGLREAVSECEFTVVVR